VFQVPRKKRLCPAKPVLDLLLEVQDRSTLAFHNKLGVFLELVFVWFRHELLFHFRRLFDLCHFLILLEPSPPPEERRLFSFSMDLIPLFRRDGLFAFQFGKHCAGGF
jgi:hypothetical protein